MTISKRPKCLSRRSGEVSSAPTAASAFPDIDVDSEEFIKKITITTTKVRVFFSIWLTNDYFFLYKIDKTISECHARQLRRGTLTLCDRVVFYALVLYATSLLLVYVYKLSLMHPLRGLFFVLISSPLSCWMRVKKIKYIYIPNSEKFRALNPIPFLLSAVLRFLPSLPFVYCHLVSPPSTLMSTRELRSLGGTDRPGGRKRLQSTGNSDEVIAKRTKTNNNDSDDEELPVKKVATKGKGKKGKKPRYVRRYLT